MPTVKVLKEPGFLYDLNYLFYLKFNLQYCIDGFVGERKKAENTKYFQDILRKFGDISEDLYVFYHGIDNGRSFVATYYLDPYKESFIDGFDFKSLTKLLSDGDVLAENMIRFYLSELTEEEVAECVASPAKLFARIKSSDYSSEEKSKLYEFFHDPAAHLQILLCELTEKEMLLADYYKDNYETILDVHNKTTFEVLCENVKDIRDLSFLRADDQTLYTSFCLLSRYYMQLFFISKGGIYILGYDYIEAINELSNRKTAYPLVELCSALGEENRMQIMYILAERGEATCKDLEKCFHFSGSTAYHHVTLLVRYGAVKIRNVGKTIYYSVNRSCFDYMIQLLKEFSNN